MSKESRINWLIVAILWAAVTLSGCVRPPKPDDEVRPDDKKGSIVFVILDNIMQRNTKTTAVIGDNALWQQLQADGLKRKVIDSTQTEAAQPYLDRAKEKNLSLPALFVVNERTGKILLSEILTDSARIKTIAAKYTPKSARGPPPAIYIEEETGVVRRLGMIPADEAALKKRAKMVPFLTGLKARGASLIPRDQWKAVEYPQFHKPEFVLNQQNTSGCVGFSCAAAHMKLRSLHGHLFEILSGPYIYSGINGGSDSGAMILDSDVFLRKYGVCLKSEMDLPSIYWRQASQKARESALSRQMILSYPIDTEEQMATALQLGMVVQAGVQVDGNFGRFDSNGISYANGRYANHSIHIYGMKQVDGEWVYYMGNTWGYGWGPWKNGSCFLRAKGVILRGDAFVHADSKWNPNDLPNLKRLPASQPSPIQPIHSQKGPRHALDARFVLAQ